MLQKVVNQNLNNNIYASGIQNSPLAILIQECAFDGYNDSEYSALLCSLIELKNSLIEQGRYTDVIDEILIKLSKSKRKKRRL